MKLIECPRDAWQGLSEYIPVETKASYINQLLKVGFDTIDFGSFVNPKVMPQMKDTSELVDMLDWDSSGSSLLAIVANVRGAEDAVKHPQISYLGFPLSLSETFQQRNTNRSIPEALDTVRKIQELCQKSDKTLVIYLSMGFGNPYGDPFNEEVVLDFSRLMDDEEIKVISLADTIGVAEPAMITSLFRHLIPAYPHIEFGAHFHSNPQTASEKINAALEADCKRFDGAIKGFGGCPMADDDLVGNIPTEVTLSLMQENDLKLDQDEFQKAMAMSLEVFH